MLPLDYEHPVTHERITFAEMPTGQLAGLIQFLAKRGAGDSWIRLNGDACVKAACREWRARVKNDLRGMTMACANRLDPPPCACGKRGLRIIGTTTFCRACVAAGKHLQHSGRRWMRALHQTKSQAIMANRRERDYKDLAHARAATAQKFGGQ